MPYLGPVRAFVSIIALSVAAPACTSIEVQRLGEGREDVTSSVTSSGGQMGVGGNDGAGGAASDPTRLPDWSGAMLGAYDFEGDSLGTDTSGNGRNLMERDAPTVDDDARTGQRAMAAGLTPMPAGLDAVTERALEIGNAGLTFGGWVRPDELPPTGGLRLFMSKAAPGAQQGYIMEWISEASLGYPNCALGWETTWQNANATGRFSLGTWIHVVCRFFRDPNTVTTFVDGANDRVNDDDNPIVPASDEFFRINDPQRSIGAAYDDVFVTDLVLTEAAIRRIWACGVDGSNCRCDPADRRDYTDCAAAVDCASLPPCDLETPPTR
ncbi:MAG: LamG-like jellyroll fold domain-containing protein [Myxococcota bacterium]